jgi:hypothetical protein
MNRLNVCLTTCLLLLCGCDTSSQPVNRTTGVYMLLDTSGTYSQELDKAQQIINFTLSRLNPGDSFAVARIDTGSFSEKDIVAKVTFDDRPSTTNGQKRQFRDEIAKFVETVRPAQFTDISGGLLQAIEFLAEKDPGQKTILIFSDLKEDLDEGYIRDFSIPFDDTEVIALNVTKLRSDNIDPREYMDRLQAWRTRVEQSGGLWRVINDLDRIENIFG